jgi:DNA-directed RNA polymerase subunit M/transcription elongation factor TFIIS
MEPQDIFCPTCKALLVTDNEGEVSKKCPICSFTRPIEQRHLLRSNKFKDHGNAIELPYGMLYDDAVKRSTKIACQDEECPSKDIEQWGNMTTNNIRIQPDTMIINYNDRNRVATYVCRICGLVYKPKHLN